MRTLIALLLALTTPLALAQEGKPPAEIDGGALAYTNGAWTPDGQHFVYARVPAKGTTRSALIALEVRTGEQHALGEVPLGAKPPAKGGRMRFAYSMGVLAASNDLTVIQLAQYGPGSALRAADAILWDGKARKPRDGGAVPAAPKAAKPQLEAKLVELDAEAAAKRHKTYLEPKALLASLGKRAIAVGGKQIEVTALMKGLFERAVADYPEKGGPKGNGMLPSESLRPVARIGDRVFVAIGLYVHYGVWGKGYQRILLLDAKTGELLKAYDHVGTRYASGVRFGPAKSAWKPAPTGTAVAGIESGRLRIYQLP